VRLTYGLLHVFTGHMPGLYARKGTSNRGGSGPDLQRKCRTGETAATAVPWRGKLCSRGGTDSPSRKVRTPQGKGGRETRPGEIPRESATETNRRWRGHTWVAHRQGWKGAV